MTISSMPIHIRMLRKSQGNVSTLATNQYLWINQACSLVQYKLCFVVFNMLDLCTDTKHFGHLCRMYYDFILKKNMYIYISILNCQQRTKEKYMTPKHFYLLWRIFSIVSSAKFEGKYREEQRNQML